MAKFLITNKQLLVLNKIFKEKQVYAHIFI